MLTLQGLANRKVWGWSLSILPQVLPTRMAESNGSLLPSSIGYVPCSMVGHFLLSYEVACGPKLPTLTCITKLISSFPIEI